MDSPRQFFLAFAGILLGLGLLMVYTASVTSRPTEFEQVYLTRHLAAAMVGLLAAGLAASRPAAFWARLAPWLFALTVLLLVAVLIPGVGVKIKGAQRWLRVGGVSIQPSELAKIALPLFTCTLLAARSTRLRGLYSGTAGVLWPTAIVAPLVFLEPDLGTAAFLCVNVAVALAVMGWPLRNFVLGGAALIGPATIGLLLLKPYQQRRIVGFLETWNDWTSAPYQIQQSLVTLGAGGWWGTGLGRGWQKLSFLPEANTDFVFAVVGEELGLCGTLAVVAVWCGLFLCGVRMLSVHPPRSFAFGAGFVLLTGLVMQAALNVAVVTAMVPPKGISHPLLSAGGSNLVVSLTLLGIVWSLARTAPQHVSSHEDSLTRSSTDERSVGASITPVTGGGLHQPGTIDPLAGSNLLAAHVPSERTSGEQGASVGVNVVVSEPDDPASIDEPPWSGDADSDAGDRDPSGGAGPVTSRLNGPAQRLRGLKRPRRLPWQGATSIGS